MYYLRMLVRACPGRNAASRDFPRCAVKLANGRECNLVTPCPYQSAAITMTSLWMVSVTSGSASELTPASGTVRKPRSRSGKRHAWSVASHSNCRRQTNPFRSARRVVATVASGGTEKQRRRLPIDNRGVWPLQQHHMRRRCLILRRGRMFHAPPLARPTPLQQPASRPPLIPHTSSPPPHPSSGLACSRINDAIERLYVVCIS